MNFSEKSVLVIDDYATLVRIISRMMREVGFGRIDSAKDGEEGLYKLRSHQYDVATCDWSMEGVTGADVLAACKREPDLQSTPIVMIGGDMQGTPARIGGADGFLCKPFNVHILRDVLTSVLERRALALPRPERNPTVSSPADSALSQRPPE
jgi:two-component system, chemotaxis family, chemotaxis protein CheY